MELEYKKLRCDGGHELILQKDAFPPRFCPECNRPIVRKRIHLIPCQRDGSVPGEDGPLPAEDGAVNGEDSLQPVEDGPVPGEDSLQPAEDGPVPAEGRTASEKGVHSFFTDTETIGADTFPEEPARELRGNGIREVEENRSVRRRRSSSVTDEYRPPLSRRRSPSCEVSAEKTGRGRFGEEAGDSNMGYRGPGEQIIQICSGADVLQVDSEGGYLGRQELGKEFLSLNPLVSRRHCFVRRNRNGGLLLRDEGSLNGTFVDSGDGRRKLLPEEQVSLEPGRRFWLGNQLFIVETCK